MTAELIMPTLPGDQHQVPQPRHHFQRPPHMRSVSYQVPASSHQISPLSSSNESQENSSMPSSPRAYHARQARPLYMPAVLRPNSEFTQKLNRASTAPQDDQFDGNGRRLSNGSGGSSSSFINVPGLAMIQRLSRRSTGDSGKCVEGGLDLELFPLVTDVPTREHWKVSSIASPILLYSQHCRLRVDMLRRASMHKPSTPHLPPVYSTRANS